MEAFELANSLSFSLLGFNFWLYSPFGCRYLQYTKKDVHVELLLWCDALAKKIAWISTSSQIFAAVWQRNFSHFVPNFRILKLQTKAELLVPVRRYAGGRWEWGWYHKVDLCGYQSYIACFLSLVTKTPKKRPKPKIESKRLKKKPKQRYFTLPPHYPKFNSTSKRNMFMLFYLFFYVTWAQISHWVLESKLWATFVCRPGWSPRHAWMLLVCLLLQQLFTHNTHTLTRITFVPYNSLLIYWLDLHVLLA